MNDTARERIRTLVESKDGFYIAEMDMKLRGPGEFFGTRQSGLPALRIANILRDGEILEIARAEAVAFVAHPPRETICGEAVGLHPDALAAAVRAGAGGLDASDWRRVSQPHAEDAPGHGNAAHAGPFARVAVQHLAHEIAGAVFVDAYAGTGAVGIEALSRGASGAPCSSRSRVRRPE